MGHDPVGVLIVGAGASGAALAWSLRKTGLRILCLEQGDWMQHDKYPSNLPDYELHRLKDFDPNPNRRRAPSDYPINDTDSRISVHNFNAVGGATINYIAHFPRLHPSDFKAKTLDGVADDWPVDYQTLEPFFAINDKMMGVSGLGGNPAYPPRLLPHPPLPRGNLGHTIAKGFNELGWHWWPSDAAILSREHEGRAACVSAGPCDLGCASGAKGSTDITYWPIARRAGVEIRTRCRVREITVNKRGMADGVLYYDEDGKLTEQKAEMVVMACNGIGTPRILLNSRSKLFPDGLANRSGLVGKNLMFHPCAGAIGFFDEPLDGFKGPMGTCLHSHEFYETDPSRDFVRGYGLQLMRNMGGPMSVALGAGNPIPWGQNHRGFMDSIYGHIATLGFLTEDLPMEHNRVTLDPDLTDSDGIPAPKITYRQDENNKKMMAHGLERAVEALEAAGARQTMKAPMAREAGWHLMGTARMGTDPERSVVNAWGRCHDVKNLFIVDGSIFVTSGAVNPTSTIQALALYIGDCIKKNLSNLFD
jgi:choline dehydrogenase-like flavoprotein